MTVNSDLKSWLERPKLNAKSSLELAIKVWNSVEFMYTSKYDVIVEHFTEVLARPLPDTVDQTEFLTVVKEFVNLQYPIGGVSQGSKKSLVNAVIGMKFSDPGQIQEHIGILRSLQMHSRMANFYNSNQKLYGEIVSKLFGQHLVLLEKEALGEPGTCVVHIDEIKQHLKDIRTFCQYNLSSTNFETVFATELMPSLTNVVIQCQSMDHPVDQEYFSILELIFFNSEKVPKLREYFKNYPAGELNYFKLFPSDNVLLVFLDGLLCTYRNDKDMVDLLLNCVFEKLPSDFNKTEILTFRHILFLLRKYDVNVSHYQTTSISRISSLIMSIVAKKSQSHPVEVLDLICQAVQWNPMIIHDEVLVVIVHFMTVDKDQKTLVKFAELQRRVMSGRVNRFEKRTGKLLELVKGEIDKLIAGQQLKRKGVEEAQPTPSKKKKKLNDSSAVVASNDQDPAAAKEKHFLGLLESSYSQSEKVIEEEPAWIETWSSLSNMWPKSVSQLWGQSVANLVSKTSLVIWKALLINLKESLELAAAREYDQQSILYNKFVCCFLVEYLSGTRVLEHTDQQYEVIEGMCAQTKEALKKFGKQILETEHNTDLVSAFLSVVIKYGSFETSLLYYHPDSIIDANNSVESSPELRKIDFKQKAHSVYEFLTTDEWSLVEQRVINFGKESCRSMFHDLNFRKVRSITLCDPEFVCKDTKTWNKAIIGDLQLLTKFTEHCVYFDEFVRGLSRKNRLTLAQTLFEAEGGDEQHKRRFVDFIGEQYELMELSALVLLNVISEKHLPKGAFLKSIDFATMMQQQEGEIALPDVEEMLTKQGEKKKVNKIDDEEGLLIKIKLINALPLGYLKEREKELFYTLLVLLCNDLSGHLELQDLVLDNIRMIRELGFRFDGLKYLTLSSQLQMLPTQSGRSMVLDTVGNFFGDSQLKQIKALLKRIAKDEMQNEDLILLMAERFSMAKKNHKNEKLMTVYKMKLNKLVFQVYERNAEKGAQDAAGLLYALNMYLGNKDNLTEPNPDLGKLCLRVAQNKLMTQSEAEEEHKSKIIGYCFQHMTHFVLDLKDLEAVLDQFWQKMKTTKDLQVITTKSKVDLLALFNVYAGTEKYIEILTEISDMAEKEQGIEDLRVICKLLQILSRSGVNQAKGMVLSEFLKKTLDVIILRFTLQVDNVYDHPEVILDILKCFSIAAQNRQIVMSQSLFANILSFCLDINLKRFKVTELNTETFDRIHQQLTQLCTNLIQARSLALKNAMPQFVSLMKDLIHTICAFRNERSDAKQKLSEEEVKMLSNLAHRLEPILNGFADRDHLGRKVAPYLLVYVINEMIFNPNSTTLYPGVKLAINNVCYKLIAICDVKYSQFILRGCSEASRDVYKTLVKDYEQYYKFQGKV